MQKYILTFLGLIFCSGYLFPQEWRVPEKEKENVSLRMFDTDNVTEGELTYQNYCLSCHGNPTQSDFALMVPSPGDIASDKFQSQTDGEIFYKIKTGRGAMPRFEDALDREQIWSLVAYIRSFNKKYVQPEPDLEGIEIPHIRLKLNFDDNVDKLVVKTLDGNGEPMLGVEVKAFIKGSFGNYLLGKKLCNELGIAYFNIDPKMPGDEKGFMEVIVKATKGFGMAKAKQKMQIVKPVTRTSAIEGRHLWSVSSKAPYWLIITFWLVVTGIWGTIIYVITGLLKVKKHS